jgi:hypothetical protein
MINQTERLMASEDTWPLRLYEITGTIAADAQYTDFPDGTEASTIKSAHVLFGDQWLPLAMGISPADRSVYTAAMRATPAQKWDVNVARPGRFEIWPIGGQEQTVLFRGQKAIGGMVEENDTCVLDADALVLRVAAVILASSKSENAAYKLQQAKQHTLNLLKGITTTAVSVNLGARRANRLRPYIDFIPPGGS